MPSRDLKVVLLGEDRTSGAFNSAGKNADSMGSRFHAIGATIGTFAGAGLVALGGLGIAGAAAGLKTAASMETARISFTTMLGSAEKADTFLRQLAAFAAKTPFEFPELQTAASSLISAGFEAGKVIPIMTTLGNVTSGMGTGAEGVQRATVALQQMSAAGKITGEDLNQLRDAGVPVFDLLSAATGRSKEAIADLASKGKLGKKDMQELFDALGTGKGLERFNGLMEKQSNSLSGVFSTLKDTVNMTLSNLVAPALPAIKSALLKVPGIITGTIDTLRPIVGRISDVLGAAFTTVKADVGPFITDAVAKIKAGAPAMIESLKTGLADAAAGVRDAAQPIIDALRSGISTGDYGPLGKALGEALAQAIAAAGSAAKSIGAAIGGLLGKVDWAGLAVTMGKQAPAVLLGFAIGLLNFDFGAAISVLKDHWFEALLAVVTLAFAPARVIGKLGEILAKIPFVGSLLKWALDALVSFSGGLVAKVGEVLSFMGRSFLEGFARVFPGVGTGFLNSLMILPQNLIIIAGRVGGEAVALMQRLLGGISGGIGAVIAKIGELIGRMIAPFVEVVARFVGFGADIIGALARGVAAEAGVAGNAVRAVFAGIDRVGSALGGVLADAGAALMHGLANGIRNAAGAAIQAAKDAAAAVAHAAKGVLGIHSPSRVFAEIGKNVGLGMALGIDGERRNVTQSVRDLADLAGMQVGGPGFVQSRVGAAGGAGSSGGSSTTNYNVTLNGHLDDRMDEQSILTALRRVELLAV